MNAILRPYRLHVDDPLYCFHSGNQPLDRNSVRPGLHLGTARQSLSRGGACLDLITIKPGSQTRLVDKAENEWSKARIDRADQAGYGYAVYLNRHEGVDLAEVEQARDHPKCRQNDRSVDGISDTLFKRLVPSAQDSLLLIDPSLIVSILPLRSTKPCRSLPSRLWAPVSEAALAHLTKTGHLPAEPHEHPALAGLTLFYRHDDASGHSLGRPILSFWGPALKTAWPLISGLEKNGLPIARLLSSDWTSSPPMINRIIEAVEEPTRVP